MLEKGPKYFRQDIGGKDTAVTVDRLKPHTGGAANNIYNEANFHVMIKIFPKFSL